MPRHRDEGGNRSHAAHPDIHNPLQSAMRILLVDDDDAHRRLLALHFADKGHIVDEAADGLEALEVLRQYDIHAVLADILMPRMDGYQLSTEIRLNERTRDIPIVLYSGIYTLAEDEALALSSGADAFFRKPVTEERLLQALTELSIGTRKRGGAVIREEERSDTLKQYSTRLVRRLEQVNAELIDRANELKHSESILRTVTYAAGAAIFIYSGDGIQFANPAAATLTGFSVDELLTMSLLELVETGFRRPVREHALKPERLGPAGLRIELKIRPKNGEPRWIDFVALPIEYEGAQAIVGTALDITERKEIEEKLRESAENYRELVENSLGLICRHDLEGRILAANPAASRQLGYGPLELIGKNLQDLLSPSIRHLFPAYIERIRLARTDSGFMSILTKSGEERIWLYQNVLSTKEGRPTYVVGHASDATAHIRMEEELRESQSRLRTIIDAEPECVKVLSASGTILEINPAGIAMIEAKDESMVIGRSVYPLIAKEYRDGFRSLVADVFRGERRVLEFEMEGMQGTRRWLETHAVPLRDKERNITAMLSVTRDMTKRKRAEREILLKKSFLESILENSLDVIATVKKDGTLGYSNTRLRAAFGYTREQVEGRHFLEFIPEHRSEFMKLKWEEINAGISGTYETEVLKADGTLVPCLVSHSILPEFGEFLVIMKDLTELKQMEQELRFTKERLQSFFDNTGDSIAIFDLDGKVLQVNKAFERLYGWSEGEVVGVRMPMIPPELRQDALNILNEVKEGRQVVGYDTRRVKKDGTTVEVSVTSSPVRDAAGNVTGLAAITRDLSDRRRLEAELYQAQKMESIGTLAAGIAHDFNNILGIILGYSSQIAKLTGDPENFSKSVDAIEHAVKRGSALTKQLLSFSRKADVQLEIIQVNDVVDEIVNMMRETFPKLISISSSLAKDLPPVAANEGYLHQVLMNLAVNARDAMLAGGALSITTQIIDGEVVAKKHATASAKRYVMVRVSDTGNGMDEETKKRIFEPFFSTKGKGRGTGLGLSVVYGIMQSHGGLIDVQTEPGKGTIFSLYFPGYE